MSSAQIAASGVGLEDILRRVENDAPESVRVREQNVFDEIAGPFSKRLVLFGCGPLGKEVLAGLRRAGVEPLAFADNNQKLWSTEVAGVPVLSRMKPQRSTRKIPASLSPSIKARPFAANLLPWAVAESLPLHRSSGSMPKFSFRKLESNCPTGLPNSATRFASAMPCWPTSVRSVSCASNYFGATRSIMRPSRPQ